MPYQLKITLQDVKPPVWRRVIVPSELTLFHLHHVIQIVMGWEDCHLHDFTIQQTRYAVPSPEDFDDPIDERETALCDVAGPRSRFVYQYDLGDEWEHAILVEKVFGDETLQPICMDGARTCPPEDSGGPWGYAEKLEALANPDDDESEDLRDWIGMDFDPERFDRDAVNMELQRFFRSGRGNKKTKTRRSPRRS